jgi:hypothetical protein
MSDHAGIAKGTTGLGTAFCKDFDIALDRIRDQFFFPECPAALLISLSMQSMGYENINF